MEFEQLIDKAERTEPSWSEGDWEDSREGIVPSTRQAYEDREKLGAAQKKLEWTVPRTTSTQKEH